MEPRLIVAYSLMLLLALLVAGLIVFRVYHSHHRVYRRRLRREERLYAERGDHTDGA